MKKEGTKMDRQYKFNFDRSPEAEEDMAYARSLFEPKKTEFVEDRLPARKDINANGIVCNQDLDCAKKL